MATALGYSAMTMTRAFDELTAASLGQISTSGRRRQFRLGASPRSFWSATLPLLCSPVKKRIYTRGPVAAISGPRAGLLALSDTTMLMAPERDTLAMSGHEWRTLRNQRDLVEAPEQDLDAVEIEIWSYSPAQLADNGRVDPLSLYLSLRNSGDERVEAALEELMGQIEW